MTRMIRNISSLLMCVIAISAFATHAKAADCDYWDWFCADRPTSENGCTVTENAFDIWNERNKECPTIRYEGSCNWAEGCGDALTAADDTCDWWSNEIGRSYLIIAFECTDPLENPPTDFTFQCEPWFMMGCQQIGR